MNTPVHETLRSNYYRNRNECKRRECKIIDMKIKSVKDSGACKHAEKNTTCAVRDSYITKNIKSPKPCVDKDNAEEKGKQRALGLFP